MRFDKNQKFLVEINIDRNVLFSFFKFELFSSRKSTSILLIDKFIEDLTEMKTLRQVKKPKLVLNEKNFIYSAFVFLKLIEKRFSSLEVSSYRQFRK